MTQNEFLTLFDYDNWATGRLLEAAASVDTASFKKDLGASFQSLHGTLVHIYGAQALWLARWKGVSARSLITTEQVPTLADLRARWAELQREIRDYLQSITDDRIQRPLDFQDTSGTPWSMPLHQQIHHLLFHSMYHRGQVVTLLRQLGQVPPRTDLIAYYREHMSAG